MLAAGIASEENAPFRFAQGLKNLPACACTLNADRPFYSLYRAVLAGVAGALIY